MYNQISRQNDMQNRLAIFCLSVPVLLFWNKSAFRSVSFIISVSAILPVQYIERIRLCAKAQIALFIEPHSQRVPVGNKKPLAHIKLGAVDQQGALDVLLHDPLTILDKCWIAVHQAQDLIKALDTLYTLIEGETSHARLCNTCKVRLFLTSHLCLWTLLQVWWSRCCVCHLCPAVGCLLPVSSAWPCSSSLNSHWFQSVLHHWVKKQKVVQCGDPEEQIALQNDLFSLKLTLMNTHWTTR